MSHHMMNHNQHGQPNENPMNTMSDDHTMMKMYFHFGLGDILLFKNIQITNDLQLVISCFIFLIIAILYEGLKYYRQFVFKKNCKFYQLTTISNQLDQENAGNDVEARDSNSDDYKNSNLNYLHFYQSILHVLQVAISYTLMLAFMTFNIWICCSILIGAGVGYFIFFKRKLPYEFINEHCH